MQISSTSSGSGLSDRLALIIEGLCGAVAARASGHPTAASLLVLVWVRLRRLLARFRRLVEHAAAGTMPVRRLRAAAPVRPLPTEPGRRLPTAFAWLVRLVPEANSYGSQLQHLLSQPEMAALIAAMPQAGRLFGPLGRMLALSTGPRPPKVRVRAAHAAPMITRPAVAVGDDDSPASGFLPSGVPYWARNAWPGHDYAGLEPPPRRPQAAVRAGRERPGGLPPAVDRSD